MSTSTDALRARVRQYDQDMPMVSVEMAGRKIRLVTPNEKCLYFALSLEKRETTTNQWILGFKPEDVFFDIGANNGIYGLMAAVLVGCTVYAFEPHFASYYVMCRNIYANALQERMFAYPLALSDSGGFGTLYLSAISAGKSLNNYGDARPHDNPLWHATIPQGAVSTTLDRFVDATGVLPTHIKVDVDGLEPAIVAGGARVLGDERVKSVLIEIDEKDEAHRAIHERMKAFGFTRHFPDPAGVFFFR